MKLFDNMPYGRVTGIGSIAIGIVFILMNVGTIYYNGTYYPKLLYTGIIIIFFGIGIFLFPGGNFKKGDIPAETKHLKYIWQQAPILHRVLWIIFTAAGVICAIKLMIVLKRGF